MKDINLKLSREDAGIVMDSLIEHLRSTRCAESVWGYGSYNRINTCTRLIKEIELLSETQNAN